MKYRLKHTKFQIVLEFIAILLLIGMYAYLILRWGNLPNKLPGHYNAAGEINRWGNRGEAIVLPVASTVLYLILTVISFFPTAWNIPVSITEVNRDRVYGSLKYMLMVMKLELIATFFYLNYNMMEAKSLTPFFMPVVLIVVFGTIAFFVIRTIKAAKK